MIAVDTSALVAIVLKEPIAQQCVELLAREAQIVMSAGTLTEALIVSEGKGLTDRMLRLINKLTPDVLPVSETTAHRIADVYRRWGRGRHPANLNFGDCFAYDAARSNGCPLLFVGNDFSKTDIASAL